MNYQDQSTAVLQQLAMKYGKHPACLGWGLLNEPVSLICGHDPSMVYTKCQLSY